MEMNYLKEIEFLTEMSNYQITGHEFFSQLLLRLLKQYYNLTHVVIYFYNKDNQFLSWKTIDSIEIDSDIHPYHLFQNQDIVRQTIFQNASRMGQTFNHYDVKGYQSTKVIIQGYDESPYVDFIQHHFNGYYSLNYAFGINGYVQLVYFKTKEEGNFSQEEINDFDRIYMYVANAYKNFKKYRNASIMLDIMNDVVDMDIKAFLIVDSEMNILRYNDCALAYIKEILGLAAVQEILQKGECQWLAPLLLKNETQDKEVIQTRIIKNHEFKIHSYQERYPCGIIDQFYWISICPMNEKEEISNFSFDMLTPMEQKVVNLMYQGLTYQEIANELVLSFHTIKNHVQNIYRKCDVTSRYELYKWMEKNK